MLPREEIATARIPGGDTLTLVSHGRDFIIMLGRDELMGTRMQFSEERVMSGIKRLKAAKGKASQQRMDSFFTISGTSQSTFKRKPEEKKAKGKVKKGRLGKK